MGLVDDLVRKIDSHPYALKALAALSSQFEPARETIILKLKDCDLARLLKSEHAINLLLSLSRACKLLKQILCDDPLIVEFLKSSYSDLHI